MTKILPPTYLLAAILLMFAAHFLFPMAALISFPWRFVGVLPITAGIALNIAADRQFKRFSTTVKPFQKSSALVTDGVFWWSRNPMYLGMILIVSGIANYMKLSQPGACDRRLRSCSSSWKSTRKQSTPFAKI